MSPTPQKTFFWQPLLALWLREMLRFVRQRNRVVGAFATPVVFWIFIGSGVGTSFNPGFGPEGASYLQYFFPGTLVMIVLFTAIFSTISVIEDRREGFLQGVLVAPVSPLALAGGKILGGATLAVGQALLFLALAPLAGFKFGLLSFAVILIVLCLLGVALTALGLLIAWPMDSTMGFHAIMNLFLLPLWFLSGALFPVEGASPWIRWIVQINPLYYGLCLMRVALNPGGDYYRVLPDPRWCFVVTVVFAAVLSAGCAWLIQRRRQA
ncbi:MAG: ABC transporter permease [Verrucomicrobiae bacterium]|nr:ABC transporter permease [Verrucomicrobiae bacterium]